MKHYTVSCATTATTTGVISLSLSLDHVVYLPCLTSDVVLNGALPLLSFAVCRPIGRTATNRRNDQSICSPASAPLATPFGGLSIRPSEACRPTEYLLRETRTTPPLHDDEIDRRAYMTRQQHTVHSHQYFFEWLLSLSSGRVSWVVSALCVSFL